MFNMEWLINVAAQGVAIGITLFVIEKLWYWGRK